MGCSNESETEHLDFNITEVNMIDTSVELINNSNKGIQVSYSDKVEVVNLEV